MKFNQTIKVKCSPSKVRTVSRGQSPFYSKNVGGQTRAKTVANLDI